MSEAMRLSDRRPPFVRLTHGFGRTLITFLSRRVTIEGLDQVAIPRTGPLIIAANHISNADPGLIGPWISPAIDRQLHWLGKEESLRWPLVGWAIGQNGVIGVRRGAADLDAFRTALRVLEEGLVLVVFPEGTRSRTGALQRAKDGVAILAHRSGAPILPVGITGTERLWPRGGFLRFTDEVTMRIGEPFRIAPPSSGADRKAETAAATELVMQRIAALLPPGYRGVYAGPEETEEGVSAPRVT